MKIHLVDGTYELFRSHFGVPPKKSPDGMEVGATLGLVRSLMLLLSDPEVTHVAEFGEGGTKLRRGLTAECFFDNLAEQSAIGLALGLRIQFAHDLAHIFLG